jgi:hypothetical protein
MVIKQNPIRTVYTGVCLTQKKEVSIHETWCLWIIKHLQDLLLLQLLLATTDLHVMHM